jgi:hypothetical protein
MRGEPEIETILFFIFYFLFSILHWKAIERFLFGDATSYGK